jgi:hypothetical protein
MKTLAFAMALAIAAVGAVALLVPSSMVWLAHHVTNPGAFYVVAAIRVAFGLILLSAASKSRAPKTLRVMGGILLVVGVSTALTAMLAMDRARALIDWWLQQGPTFTDLAGVIIVALGGFIAYACAPTRRAV